jgi:trafficking protein particle complex subunit 6
MSLSPLQTTPLPAPPGSTDPLQSFLSTTCMDLLLIELVSLSRRLATATPTPRDDDLFLDTNSPQQMSLDEDAERETMYFRLEPLGFRVGQGIAERYDY